MLLMHLVRLAASRTFWTAGTSNAIRMAMMAITTSSSMSVKASPLRFPDGVMTQSPEEAQHCGRTPQEEVESGRHPADGDDPTPVIIAVRWAIMQVESR